MSGPTVIINSDDMQRFVFLLVWRRPSLSPVPMVLMGLWRWEEAR